MAEPAIKRAQPSSLRGASLKLLQGEGTRTLPQPRNKPTLHALSDMRLASDLQESQQRDRMGGRGDEQVSDDTLKSEGSYGEGSVLELEPRSYTNRESSSEQKEIARQRAQAKVAARFSYPETSMEPSESLASGPASGIQRVSRRRERQEEAQPREDVREMDRAQGFLSEQRRDAARIGRMMSGEGIRLDDALAASQAAQQNLRFTQLVIKLVQLPNLVTTLWVVFVLNVEMWNILLFRKKAPTWINSALNLIGLNIDVDPNHVWTSVNLATVLITIFLDIIVFFILAATLLLFLFVTYWILQAFDIFCLWGLAC